MTRDEIRQRFRAENPEITERVLADSTLNSWLTEGNRLFSTSVRMFTKTISFTSVIDQDEYNIVTEAINDGYAFFDIDEFPGGGVAYNGKRIDRVSKSDLDSTSYHWRSRDSGTPKAYYRKNDLIIFDRPCDAALTIDVDVIVEPDTFNNDTIEPFNGLSYLRPYHYSLVLYLQGRAKMAVGKDSDKARAMDEYENYVRACKRNLEGGRSGVIRFTPPDVLITRRYQR